METVNVPNVMVVNVVQMLDYTVKTETSILKAFFGCDQQWHAVQGNYSILDTLAEVICVLLDRTSFCFLDSFFSGHAAMITLIFE